MALVDNTHYVTSVGWSAVTAWATGASKAAGALVRQNATPTAGNERVYVCIVAGTTHATTEPTWTFTRGVKITDNTVTWQECTGLSAVNGDLTNTPNWTAAKAATPAVLGQIIQRNNGVSYQICTTAGAMSGSEPAFSDTAGVTTTDTTAVWTSLGAVGNFTGGQAPHARTTNCLTTTWAQAGNSVFVKSDHNSTRAGSNSYVGAGTAAAPINVICHGGGAYPPTSSTTGAIETVTGVNNHSFAGYLYVEGIKFVCSTNGGNIFWGSSTFHCVGKNLQFACTGAGSSQVIDVNNGGNPQGRTIWDNVTCEFSHVSQGLGISGRFQWRNTPTAIVNNVIPTLLTFAPNVAGLHTDISGCDFNNVGSGKTLVGQSAYGGGRITFTNCKVNASATLAATPNQPSQRFEFINCDSGDTHYKISIFGYEATLTDEITIVRTGGATDGETPISWKVVTNANCKVLRPFECPPIAIWNTSTGSKTITIQGIWGGGAVPTNNDIWMEVDYLGTSGVPLASTASDAPTTSLTAAGAQTAGSGTWGGSTTKFSLDCTVTINEIGFIYARVRVGKASDTFYIDPKITVT